MKNITRICLPLALFAGCDRQIATTLPPTSGYFGRLNAALALKNDTARHNSLVTLAEDAALSGNSDVVLRAIAAVDAGTARDNTCAICSRALAKRGKTSEATVVAKELVNETARNNTLAQIASGDQ